MTSYLTNRPNLEGGWQSKAGLGVFTALLAIPVLYLLTLARSPVFGDPTEYTFVANTLGIAHPPGYAFITLLGKVFQTLIPFGNPPWRMHLLSAAAATLASLFVFGSIRTIGQAHSLSYASIAGLFGALVVATATNFWQHAIHTNPHVITAAFLATNLFFLTKWWSSSKPITEPEASSAVDGEKVSGKVSYFDGWLFAFCLSAGLGAAHHPLTVFSFPAYALFILWVRPGIWLEWRTLLKMLAFALIGLSLLLYYPIRSAMEPLFGPHDMNTLDGFLNHFLARGLTESLPFFGLADQLDRATVFWSLLRLQYSLPTLFLSFIGFMWLAADRPPVSNEGLDTAGRSRLQSLRPLALLYGLALLTNYIFVINLQQQDIMAYLLGVFLLIGLLAGLGLLGLLEMLTRRTRIENKAIALLIVAVFMLGPVLQIIRNAPLISLRDYDEAELYVQTVFDWFSGEGKGAVLLNDWEHMTPLWYSQFVNKSWPSPADVQPHLVSTQRPWVESVFDFLPGGPVYLSGYRPEVVAAGFRLRPRGPFYQVVEPGDKSIPVELTILNNALADELEIVGYMLPQQKFTAGDFVPLTLAMRAPTGTDQFYTPVLALGEGVGSLELEFTTDSHLVSPEWEAGEVIVDRFDFAIPHDLPGGFYSLNLGVRNLSTNEDTPLSEPLGALDIAGKVNPASTGRLLANFRQRVGLASAASRVGLTDRRQAPWDEPLIVSSGDSIQLTLNWQSLAPAEQSYTVFVHLIDQANRPLLALDYTPLGGSTPTHLWIPKWLPGQQMLDPYRIEIPEEIQPGNYLIEVGLYEMTSGRRLHMSDLQGNLIGDRYILGPVVVEE
jgi:hypothetical protein